MIYDLRKFTVKIEKFATFIAVDVIARDLLKRKDEWMPDGRTLYIYSVLFKTVNGIASANLLFCNLQSRAMYIDSAFITLRTLLSDNLIFLYLLLKSDGDNEQFSKNIKSLHYDHIRQEIANLKNIYRDGYRMSQQEYEDYLITIKANNKEFFDDEGKPIYDHITPSVTKAVKYAISMKDTVNRAFLMSAFEQYNLFSKYEHFGEYTLELIHRPFAKANRDELFLEYFEALNLLVRFISSHLRTWYTPDTEIYQRFKIYEKEINDITLYKLN